MQQIQPTQQQFIPCEVQQLVNTYRLGTPIKEYKNKTGSLMFWGIIFIFLGVIFINFGLLLFLTLFSTGFSSLVIAGVALVVTGLAFFVNYGASLIRRAWRNRGAQVYLCTGGLLLIKDRGAEAMRWDQIAEIWRAFSEFYSYGRKYYVLRQFLLRRADGTVLTLDNAFRGFKEIGAAVEQQLVSRLLPGALAAYHAGQAVSFGPISVYAQGVSMNNGQRILSWNELDRVQIAQGVISFKKKGSIQALATVPIARLPNACVFAALVSAVTNGQKLQLAR